MGFDRKRMLEVADAVERVAKRADAMVARKDANNPTGRAGSKYGLEQGAAQVQAHKVLRSEGWKHSNADEPSARRLETHNYRHEKFPRHVVTIAGNKWRHTEQIGRNHTDVLHGEGVGDAPLAFHLSRFGAQAHDRADKAENDADFDGVTSRRLQDGSTEHRRLATGQRPGYRGSGRRYETMTVEPGGKVYTQSRDGYMREHKSPEEAARHLGWGSVPRMNT